MVSNDILRFESRYTHEFFPLAISLTRSKEGARDLLQEVAYLVVKHQGSYEPGSNFSAWVKTIMHNTFLSGQRRNQRRNDLTERDQPARYRHWLEMTAVENPAEALLGAEEIFTLITSLPNIYETSFLLYFQGFKYKEIALRTGVPIGTAKSRVHTARLSLRRALGQTHK